MATFVGEGVDEGCVFIVEDRAKPACGGPREVVVEPRTKADVW
jgi:hypothetical protein